ncbi:MAG: glutathione S-transferase family protein [Burkholderiales bacterium]|nr:glutathione S-transferase family protein [Burkholderiales bacterium]
MHVLYGSRGSGSAAIEVALQCCGLPFRVVRASTWEPDSAIAELEKINPLKQIPTLVLPDGTVISESAAILIHLGISHPGSGLLSPNASQRASQLRGLVYIAANCYSAVSVSDFPERWCADPDKQTNARVRTAARAQLHRNWEIFAELFIPAPWLSGTTPGALDYLAAVVSRWSGAREHLQSTHSAFLQTLHAIEAHPQAAPVFARHWAAPAA